MSRKAKNCCQARVPRAVPKAKAEVLRRYLALVRAQGADAVRGGGDGDL